MSGTTKQKIIASLRLIEDMLNVKTTPFTPSYNMNPFSRDMPLTLMGLRVFEAPEHPVIKLSATVDVSPEFRDKFNADMLARFGTRSVVPRRSAYMIGNHSVVINRFDLMSLMSAI